MSSKTRMDRLKAIERRLRRRKLLMLIPQRRLKDYENPLEKYNAFEFKNRFHIFKETAIFVVEMIKSDLMSTVKRGVHIPPIVQFCLVERYYATGSKQLVLADLVNLSQSTVSTLIERVSSAIAKHCSTFITYPTHNEAQEVRREFYALGGFPGVVGCIDGTHIIIPSPGGKNPELFRDRKSTFSINVQAICDHKLNFTNLVARWYGSAHDVRAFENSQISMELETGVAPGLLLGDSGYTLHPYLMIPFSNPVTAAEHRYNKAQLTTRNSIERTFGVWKRRFACLMYCTLKLETVLIVIVATGILHNIARRRDDIFDQDRYKHYRQADEMRQPVETMSGKVKQREIIETHFN